MIKTVKIKGDKMKKQNQTMLTAFFLAVMLAGFGAVAYVSELYNTNRQIDVLFETNSNTDFPSYEYINTPTYYYSTDQTSQRATDGIYVFQHNKTPIYSGNNTWAISVNATGYSSNTAVYIMEIPNANNFQINYIDFEMSKNLDSDINLYVGFEFFNGNTIDVELIQDNRIFIDNNVGLISGTEYNKNISLALSDSIEIYQSANNNEHTLMYIYYVDADSDNFTPFAWEISTTIYGEQITGWSINDSIIAVLIISTIANIIIGIYMTDSIDIGGYVKDLRKQKRRS